MASKLFYISNAICLSLEVMELFEAFQVRQNLYFNHRFTTGKNMVEVAAFIELKQNMIQ